MKKKTIRFSRPEKARFHTDETNWEELDCSKKLLILLKQGYTLQYAGKGAFVAIKGDKRFFVRESVAKGDKPDGKIAAVTKEVPNEEDK